jgi:hypothetical protein
MLSGWFGKKKDINADLAALRPEDALDQFTEILKTATYSDVQSGRYSWPEFKLYLNEHGQVAECVFGSSFPANIKIEKLHIGMPIDLACKVQPLLRFFAPQSFGKGYDLVLDEVPWDLIVYEVSDKIQEITIIPKGGADERLAKGEAILKGRENSWNRVSERERWMTINDPFALLDAWLKTDYANPPWNDYPPDINRAYANWLKQATPDELHQAAIGHNWSYSLAPLFFISRYDGCDLATALHIFYAGDPYEIVRTKFDPAWSNRHSDLRLLLGIRDRVLDGFYKRSEIGFDPMRTFRPSWLPADIGPDFPTRIQGREPNFLPMHDGYPVAVWDAVAATA